MTAGERSEQRDWEARAGRPAAVAALAAALLPVIGTIVFQASVGAPGEGSAAALEALDAGSVGARIGSAITAIGTVLLPLPLAYLYSATRARRPEAPSFIVPLLAIAAAGVAVAFLVERLLLVDAAADFVAAAEQTDAAADDLLEESDVATAGLVQAGSRIALGASIIVVALNAMRAGLLGRFMGIIGIGVGAFYAVPLVEPMLIQLFWATALALLFLDRWPGGGRGPAWAAVEAIPWPTAADRMEAERRERVGQAQRQAGEGPDPAGPDPRPASRKRRRGS